MTATAVPARARREELGAAFGAVRARLGLVALLFVLAGLAWWSTASAMAGMDAGPGTALGSLGWFLGVWVVMMAAMMFPSVAPTVALYSRLRKDRDAVAPVLFAAGYLIPWAAAGLVAYGLFEAGRHVLGGTLAWHDAGRWTAGGILVVAALYELTPAKNVCLSKCRSPLGFLMSSWRDGRWGAVEMGARHGAWCVGCCWALMAGLFALGVMSLAWMAIVAGLIALEKTLPWRRVAIWGTAALLLALGIAVASVPGSVPALTQPGSPAAMRAMQRMQAMPGPAMHGPAMHKAPAMGRGPAMNQPPGMHKAPAMGGGMSSP